MLPDMQATYAVATNGSQWIVRRRIGKDWVTTPDLPILRDIPITSEWRLILLEIENLAPILYWLDETVPAEHANHYFLALQVFFHGVYEITGATDSKLLSATDNLLRVLFGVKKNDGYLEEKLKTTCVKLNQYYHEHGIESHFGGDGSTWNIAHDACAELSNQIENHVHFLSLNSALLRLLLSLFMYLKNMYTQKGIYYTDITAVIQSEVRSYLNLALMLRFNAPLPDTLQKIEINDIKSSCCSAWDQHIQPYYH